MVYWLNKRELLTVAPEQIITLALCGGGGIPLAAVIPPIFFEMRRQNTKYLLFGFNLSLDFRFRRKPACFGDIIRRRANFAEIILSRRPIIYRVLTLSPRIHFNKALVKHVVRAASPSATLSGSCSVFRIKFYTPKLCSGEIFMTPLAISYYVIYIKLWWIMLKSLECRELCTFG